MQYTSYMGGGGSFRIDKTIYNTKSGAGSTSCIGNIEEDDKGKSILTVEYFQESDTQLFTTLLFFGFGFLILMFFLFYFFIQFPSFKGLGGLTIASIFYSFIYFTFQFFNAYSLSVFNDQVVGALKKADKVRQSR